MRVQIYFQECIFKTAVLRQSLRLQQLSLRSTTKHNRESATKAFGGSTRTDTGARAYLSPNSPNNIQIPEIRTENIPSPKTHSAYLIRSIETAHTRTHTIVILPIQIIDKCTARSVFVRLQIESRYRPVYTYSGNWKPPPTSSFAVSVFVLCYMCVLYMFIVVRTSAPAIVASSRA